MFANNKEFFENISLLIEKIEAAGEIQWGSELRDAMNISFMPGEIFGAIRMTLTKFQNTKIPAQLNIEKEINEIVESLNEIL